MGTYEDHSPKFHLLTLNRLTKHVSDVLDYVVTSRTIRSAYDEVLQHMLSKGMHLIYSCEYCGALIDDKLKNCWACGTDIVDEVDEEYQQRLKYARKLGIEDIGFTYEELEKTIEFYEDLNRPIKHPKKHCDYLRLSLIDLMPDGWTVNETIHYYQFRDREPLRRIIIWKKAFNLGFSVDDGFLDNVPNLLFLDKAERKRRHYGTTNYLYKGDVYKEAIDICKLVFRRYA